MFFSAWRIKSGPPNEIVVLILFGMIAWGGGCMEAVGGIQALIGDITGAQRSWSWSSSSELSHRRWQGLLPGWQAMADR